MAPQRDLQTAIRAIFRFSACAAFGLIAPGLRAQTVAESGGVAMIQAEVPSDNLPKSLGGTAYAWAFSTNVSGYSGTGFMEAGPNDGQSVGSGWVGTSPELRYAVNFTHPGTYRVWVRAFAETSENASVHVGLNGASPSPATLGVPGFNVWTWTNSAIGSATPVTITVPAAGIHTLNIWMNDAGFRLDRILLTQNPNYTPELSSDFWRNQNIYQVVTDRFFNADPSNDTLSPNFNPADGGRAHGGDFTGLESKLDYIQALGATAVWISPVLLNGNGDYHGYAATDFYQTDPRMGSLAELKNFVQAAHRRGILVVNDVVVNHGSTLVDSAGSGFPGFLYPPAGYTLRYNSPLRYAAPFNHETLGVPLETLFHNNGGTQNWGDATQVELGELASLDDFRTESPYVRDRMAEIFSYWINEAGFDAFRIDTVKHAEMGFWDQWCPRIRAAATAADKPNFFQFGEVYDGSDAKCGSYTGTRATANYKMESVLDYPLYYQVNSVFATATGSTRQIEDHYNNLAAGYYDPTAQMSLVTFLDNHDQPRFLHAGGGTSRLNLALAFLYTARGIPCLYYGTEQDFDGGGDPGNREDMFDGQFEAGPSLGDNFNLASPRFKLIAKLNNLRRLYPSLRTGSHANLWNNPSGPGLFAYARRLGAEEVYVVLNTAGIPQTIAARPTLHAPGTVLVNLMNPAESQTVSALQEIPALTIPAGSFAMYVAQSQLKALDPVVESVSPAHDTTSVPANSSIVLAFSTAMNPATTGAAFSTSPATTGTFTWSSGNTVLTYTPAGLTGNTLHTVRLAASATNATGGRMFGSFESRFTTAASSGASPPAVASSAGSATGDTTATLGASVNPGGNATTVSFQYGLTSAYGLASSGQNIGGGNSTVAVSAALTGLVPGTSYHFRVVAANALGTTYGPDATLTTSAGIPETTAISGTATFITANSANLNGTANPNGVLTSVNFIYGLQPNVLSLATPAQGAGSGGNNLDFFAPLSSLEPGTTYYFAIQATTPFKTVQGAVQSFTTASIVPSVTTLAAENVSTASAGLRASVTPNGFAAVVYFEYGPTSEFGSTTTPVDVGSGLAPSVITTPAAGLVAGQLYHFRAVAANANGTSRGNTLTFTTGNPPPAVQAQIATSVTPSSATLNAAINPNGLATAYWFEYGTTTAYGSNTRRDAGDTAESYSSLSYSSPNNNGGGGFGPFTAYTSTSSSRGGIRLVTATSTNGTAGRFIDGVKSFSAYAGSSTTRGTHSGYRPLSNPGQSGTFNCSVRFDLDNSKGFAGLNLKSASGSSFGSNELLSIGMTPVNGANGGNQGILVTDALGQRTVGLGSEVRGSVIDVRIDFDTRAGSYTLGVKFRSNPQFITSAGTLKLSGPTVNLAAIGYINGNNSGASNQNLIFDSLALTTAGSAGSGVGATGVSGTITGLTGNSVYHYRVVAQSAAGQIPGEDRIFVTGADLAVHKTHSGNFVRGSAGQFTISVENTGCAAGSGLVTVLESPPAGMTITQMEGSGWTYNSTNFACTRTDPLGAGATYPPITVSVVFASDAAASLTNTATVTSGTDANSANNTAVDPFSLPASLTPIENWRQQYFGSTENAGEGADLFDAAGDGLPNLIKYALGMDPRHSAVTGLPVGGIAGGFLTLTFTRRRDAVDISYQVEATGDPDSAWTEVYSSASTGYEGGGSAAHQVTVPDAVPINLAPGGRRFMRLKVTRP